MHYTKWGITAQTVASEAICKWGGGHNADWFRFGVLRNLWTAPIVPVANCSYITCIWDGKIQTVWTTVNIKCKWMQLSMCVCTPLTWPLIAAAPSYPWVPWPFRYWTLNNEKHWAALTWLTISPRTKLLHAAIISFWYIVGLMYTALLLRSTNNN